MWDVEDQPERFTDPKAYTDDIPRRVHPGAIILHHPMYGRSQTSRDALPILPTGLKQRGYRVGSVSERLAADGS